MGNEVRKLVGPWVVVPLEFSFESTASAGDLGVRGADAATIAVLLFEAPWDGCVIGKSVNAVGGSFSGVTFLTQIEGSAVAASALAPGAAATGYQEYLPTAIPFVAGNSIAEEVDALSTFRDCVVTLFVAFNIGE